MKLAVFMSGLLAFLLSACKEVPPFIDFSIPVKIKDSTYIVSTISQAQHKAVLIEDITGVRCQNCPQAAQVAMGIVAQKSEDSVVVVALYSGDYLPTFTTPWPGFPLLNNQYSSQIINVLGVPQGLPSGYIDRHKFGSQSVRYNSHTSWTNFVNERLKGNSPVNIHIQKSINGRMLTVNVRIEYTTAVTENHKYSLYLTESGIVSKQTMPTSYDDNYVHNHALRYAFGNAVGNPLTASLVAGRVFEKELDYEIPLEYNIAECHLVCLVTNADTEEVVNVRQVHIQ